MNFLIYLSEEVEKQKKLCYNKITELQKGIQEDEKAY